MSSLGAFQAVLAQAALGVATEDTSGDNAELVVTAPAPGAGKCLRLQAIVAHYDDGSEHEVDIEYTDRDGNTVNLTYHTGVLGQGANRGPYPGSRFEGLITQENTAIVITAPAGGAGVTSHIELTWDVMSEWAVAEALEE